MNDAASLWPRNKELGGRWQLTGYIAAVDLTSPQNRRYLFAFFKWAKASAKRARSVRHETRDGEMRGFRACHVKLKLNQMTVLNSSVVLSSRLLMTKKDIRY